MPAIDFHAYYQPPRFLDYLRRRKHYPRVERKGEFEAVFTAPGAARVLRPEQLDLDRRIEMMDAADVKTQILRLQNVGGIDAFELDEATEMAQVINEDLATISKRYPGRFIPYAAVPIQSPERACEALQHAAGLGHRGVGVSCQIDGVGMDDERYRPFLKLVQELGLTLLVLPNHPSLLQSSLAPYSWLSGAFGFQVDLSWAALRLLASGRLTEFPDLKVIIANLGGVLTSISERLDEYWHRVHGGDVALAEAPTQALRRLYFETASADARAIALAANIFGSDRLVFGSDYPSFSLERGMRNVLDSGLAQDQIEDILWRNAAPLV